jgi:hypothetical protein
MQARRILMFVSLLITGLFSVATVQPENIWPTAHAQEAFSCANVTEIPQAECEALVAIAKKAPAAPSSG